VRHTPPLILVAHRDERHRAPLYAALEGAGYLVASLAPGIDAVRYAAGAKPAVVIADAPEDGRFFEEIRRVSPLTRIIQLGGAGGRDETCDERVAAPVRTEPLLTAVQRWTSEPAFS